MAETETSRMDALEFIQTVDRLDPGDEAYVKTNASTWSDPMRAVDVDVIEWRCPGGSWMTAEVEMTTGRTTYPFRAVQAMRSPVMERYEYPQHVLEFTPTDWIDPVEFEDWSADGDAGASVKCKGCGSHVRKDYVRVFSPDGDDRPRCCPNCEDLIREPDGTIREKRPGHGSDRA